jgi:predicted small lipoprotein YifL
MLKTQRILVIGFNLTFAVLGLCGCGQTGPLYLPQPGPAKATVADVALPEEITSVNTV